MRSATFSGEAGEPDDRPAAGDLRELADDLTDCAGRGRDDDGVARLRLTDVEEAEVGGEPGRPEHVECGLRWGEARVELAEGAATSDGVVLPAELSDDEVAWRKARVAALRHLSHRLPGHRLADLRRLRVRPRLAHPPAHVRIEREPLRAHEHFARAGLRDLGFDQRKAGLLRESLGPRGKRDLPVHAAHAEPPEQPLVNLRDHVHEERQVPLVLSEPGLSRGKIVCEPLAVRPGNHQILPSLNDERRHPNRLEVEPPRACEGEVVVDPAVDAPRKAAAEAVEHVRTQLAVECGGVDVGEEGSHRFDEPLDVELAQARKIALQRRPERRLALLCQAELDDVPLAHSLGQVEPGSVRRRDRGRRGNGDNAVRETGRRRERVRTATREPPGGEPLEPERVCDRLDVRHDIGNRAVRAPCRVAVAGTVVREQADALLPREPDVLVERHAGRGRAVVEQDGTAGRVAGVVHRQRAPVRRPDRQLFHRPTLQGSDQRGCGTIRM